MLIGRGPCTLSIECSIQAPRLRLEKGGLSMKKQWSDVFEYLIQLWQQVVLMHQKLKTDPSWQCAWDLIKLLAWLAWQIFIAYIKYH